MRNLYIFSSLFKVNTWPFIFIIDFLKITFRLWKLYTMCLYDSEKNNLDGTVK